MRVCLLTSVLDVFKGGNHLPLLSALQEVQVTILTNHAKPADPVLPSHITVETLNARLGSYYYGFADAAFARAVLKRYPPSHSFWTQFDVIHINQTMGPALLELQKTGVPICFFVHHPVSADRAIALEESSGFANLRWRLRYFFLAQWQGRFCRELPVLATVSETAADRISQDYRCDKGKMQIVPNGVDGAAFPPDPSVPEDFDVIALGAFVHPRKGFRYLIDLYRKLSAEGLRLADVGRRSVEQQALLKTIPGVRVFGTVPQVELLSLLQRSRALVSTSLYEGFGLSLIEALACGKPAFAFDGGAVGEVLKPIDPSLVVPLRDTAALANRVRTFLALSNDEQKKRGKMYRAQVLDLYSLEKAALALQNLYTFTAKKK